MRGEEAGSITEALEAHGVFGAAYSLIRSKEGVIVARVKAGDAPLVLKLFEDEPSRREIENYRILASLGVPTLRTFGFTERSVLMEDIEASPELRLGRESDLHDRRVITALARWYRLLHERGAEYVNVHGEGMYDEWDQFTRENIEMLRSALGEECAFALDRLLMDFGSIRQRMDAAPKTLCYNDFYYTNMAVSRDLSRAVMFDYNLLGKGCCINDIENVAYWFMPEERELFIKEYGGIDAELLSLQREISPVITLISAFRRGIFPDWAEEAASELKSVFAERE